jgi:tRNA A-37 threonylcarbamoyl transferase component Bud32
MNEPMITRAPPTRVGRRRPSGEAPPLPRRLSASTGVALVLIGAVVLLWIGFAFAPVVRVVNEVDLALLDAITAVRFGALTRTMRGIGELGAAPVFRVLVWSTLIVLLVFRRFQHLFAVLAVLIVVAAVTTLSAVEIGRMRPTGVEILDGWQGYAHPARPVALLGLALTIVLFALVPAGRWRTRAAWIAGGALGLLVLARLYLAVDHPTDAAVACVLGVALPIVLFRLLVPDDAFPVSYHRGVRAHLDVGAARGEAIAHAVRDQLGLEVVEVEPFALHGSAGSTPVCIRVRDERGDDRKVFGKIYALSHLRSDRWYKLGRTVLYGRLEDERPFNTVRRLVEYEDHMLRVLRDAGLRTAEPLGVVEITPEREYVLLTEFFEAEQLGVAPVDDGIIDDALDAVRLLWDAGLAHRDIKPANLLVHDEHVLLIDVAFAAVRPSPWRQAVDLANMMLTLALFSTPERVYERALRRFSADDVAEAFAASRAITIPSQLRAALKADGRDLLRCFRELAPARPPISIQRWSLRRFGLTLVVVVTLVLGLVLLVENLRAASLL